MKFRRFIQAACAAAIALSIGGIQAAQATVMFSVPTGSPGDPRTNFGVLTAGQSIFSGNINGSCLATDGRFPNCSFGDVGNTGDRFGFTLPDNAEIIDATFSVSGYTVVGFEGFDAGGATIENVRISSLFAGNTAIDGNGVLDLDPSFFDLRSGDGFPLNSVLFSVFLGGSIVERGDQLVQGVGDVSFDYQLAVNIRDLNPPTVAVSEPETLALMAVGLLGLAGIKRRRKTATT